MKKNDKNPTLSDINVNQWMIINVLTRDYIHFSNPANECLDTVYQCFLAAGPEALKTK